ncbi:MFS general substrate transporter [Rhizoctonia solani 123E]|uniref:MFS general substrate transporter n=1 Tax=Rhizoctonia solani 123E TaxID=1423351 RepID=A0A074SBP0_9AGAM|nr:MFS general substrate transporter [Rhizoctonia solani 123E]
MASSTLTLPVDTLSALPNASRASLSKSPATGIERSASPSHRHPRNHEAMEMNALGGKSTDSASTSLAPEIPAWTMSTKKEWISIMACCWCLFLAGWNDATTGPLLPTIQTHYGVNFTIVSMLFVSNCVGFVSAAVINIHLTDRLGFGKVILLGALLQILAYSILAPALPFPVMCIAYAINGFGIALQDAQANGFIAELPNNAAAKMGLLHAVYGAGAFIAPLIATQFAQLPRWSFHYLTSLGVSLANAIVLLVVFKLRRQHEIMGLPDPNVAHSHTETHTSSTGNKYKEIFSSRAVQLMAFFIWVYVGVEVTIGVVSLVASYSTNTFYTFEIIHSVGLMLGRVVLLWVNEKIGERRVVYLYCLLCIALELVIWLVPNIIGNAVAVSIVGMLLGEPLYPIAMNITGAIVPKRILTGSIGWIASFGQAGSAVFPFMTGALAQKHSVKVLQPMLVGMLSALLVLWTLIPAVPKRRGD